MEKGSNTAARRIDGESAGQALRSDLIRFIAPILSGSEAIADSATRLNIQANCLDMLIALQEVIESYDLDSHEQ